MNEAPAKETLGFQTEVKPPSVTFFESRFETELSRREMQGTLGTEHSAFYAEGSVALDQAQASGKLGVTANWNDGFQATASGQAGLYMLNAEGKLASEYGIASTSVEAQAQVGATASGNAGVTFDPLEGNVAAGMAGSAFLGGRASAEVTQTVGPVGGTAGIEGFVGIGAEFEANLGYNDGKLSAQIDVGAALGIGGSLEFGVTLDAKAVGNSVASAASTAGNAIVDAFSDWDWPAGDRNPTHSGW